MRGSVEVRVGLFVTATLALFLFFLFLLGDYRLGGGLTVYADFHFSGSLAAGAPVKISGVRIGKVTALDYVAGKKVDPPVWSDSSQDIQVRATIEIERDYISVLTANSTFMISQAGLFGEPYLELLRNDGGPVASGQLFRGRDALRLDVLLSSVSSMVTDLNLEQLDFDSLGLLLRDGSSLVKTVQKVLVDNQDQIPDIIANAQGTMSSIRQLADNGNRLLSDNGDLAKTLRNARQVSEKLSGQTDILMSEAHTALQTVQKAEPVIASLNPKQIGRIIDTTQKTMDNLQSTTQELAVITGQVKSGQGTVGALVMSQELYDDLKELISDLKQHPWKVLWRKK